MMMVQSKEVVNYNGGKPYAKVIFEIELHDDKLNGRAWVEDYPSIKIESIDKFCGENIFRETKNMKYWLEADICNLLLEFEEGVSK